MAATMADEAALAEISDRMDHYQAEIRAAIAAEDLPKCTDQMKLFQETLTQSAPFIPRNSSERAQSQYTNFQRQIDELNRRLKPKKVFSFKSRTKGNVAESPKAAVHASAAISSKKASEFSYTISEKTGETLIISADDVNGKDVELKEINHCQIRLLNSSSSPSDHPCPSTLHMSHVSDSEITLQAPIQTSIFLEHCRNLSVRAVCQQLRVHSTHDTTFHLHIMSRPIIEDCTGIRFGLYPTADVEALIAAGMNPAINKWKEIEDFNWLTQHTHSPNWSLVDEVKGQHENVQ